jgi:geranylgeranyl diphosphate synthase type II
MKVKSEPIFAPYIEMIEKGLKYYFSLIDAPKKLKEAMGYSLFSGGKRFRSLLSLLTAKTLGKEPDFVLPTACAIEYIHTYSLIHDDLPAIDDDDLRRGKPTCHKMFGEGMAILAGDALYAEAFGLILREQKGEPQDILSALREIAEATGASGMVGGQVMDILSEGKEIDEESLRYIHLHKTARLIQASVKASAFLCHASSSELSQLGNFGKLLGWAFQIVDDILNVTSHKETLGKPVGSDAEREKATYPKLFGVKKAREKAEELVEEAKLSLKELSLPTEELQRMADFVVERSF